MTKFIIINDETKEFVNVDHIVKVEQSTHITEGKQSLLHTSGVPVYSWLTVEEIWARIHDEEVETPEPIEFVEPPVGIAHSASIGRCKKTLVKLSSYYAMNYKLVVTGDKDGYFETYAAAKKAYDEIDVD